VPYVAFHLRPLTKITGCGLIRYRHSCYSRRDRMRLADPTMRIQLLRARGSFRERTTRRVAKVEIISPRLSLDSAIPITRAFRSQDAIRRTGKELSDVCLSRANQFALRLKLISAFGRRLSTRRCSRDEECASDELRRTLKSPLQRRVPMRAPVLSS